jgi:hypothetical protein
MPPTKTFSLNIGWTVEYFEPNIDGFEMAPSPEPIERLNTWTCSGRFATAGFYAYLRRAFEVEPITTHCIRYIVQLENAPGTTRVYVNDTYLGNANGISTRLDVTDYVSLGQNKLNLRLDCWEDGNRRFDDVYLLQVPCDEATS